MQSSTLTRDIKLVAIGNSRGIRLPRDLLRKYGISEALVLAELPEGILLRGVDSPKLSLDQTFAEMAVAQENWSDCEGAVADGLDHLKW